MKVELDVLQLTPGYRVMLSKFLSSELNCIKYGLRFVDLNAI
jgi:hypothetical protein